MEGNQPGPDEPSLVSRRTMEIVVSLLLLAVASVVIYDSNRLGFTWRENEGPASGYFPFYIASLLAIASLVNLVNSLRADVGANGDSFVSRIAFRRILAVLVPAIVYVGLIQWLGLYVASAIFITTFMIFVGRESILRALAVGIGVPLALFFMFEIWFLVPLPKGPVESMLGY
jgi:putative tricarboxylic transport membrane protein